ncbi:hypothetical protein ABH935_001854 [Catenulispora sp. GAS73]|uniref:preATP grasp domain-containing protein n=1 Tax=Catenulispora sp. GAS73 TaxID=3156269 RepID=UPI003513A8D4
MITDPHPNAPAITAYPNGQLSPRPVAAKLIHMSQLIIGDQLTEETAEGEGALPSGFRRFPSAIAHPVVRFVRDGEVLVPPSHPGVGFPAYVGRVMGSAEGEPLILVPPPGRRGVELLSDDRLVASEFVAGLRPFGGVAFPVEPGGELVDHRTARVLISRHRVPWPSFAGAGAPPPGAGAERDADPASESEV